MRGVLLETGNMSATIVANIVTVSIIATPEKMQIYTTLLQLVSLKLIVIPQHIPCTVIRLGN